MARVWQLLVRADGDTKVAQRELKALQRSTQNFGRNMQSMGRTLTTAVTAPIIAMGALGVNELRETMVVTAKTDAVFKSMGDTMRVTRGQLGNLVSDLERYSAIEGDIIQNAANVGLSFKALAGNPKLFEQTMKAAVDMSGALGMDVQQSVTMLGKAMQNGAKGAAALGKNGTLAKDDIAQLQAMAKAGLPLWKQQQFILAAVNKQYAGQGKNVDPLKAITVAVKNMAESLAVLLLPAIQKVSGWMQRASDWVNGLSDSQRKLVGVVLAVAAAVGPLVWVFGSLVGVFASLMGAAIAANVSILALIAPFALVAVGVVAFGAALVLAYRKSETFRTGVQRSFQAVRAAVTVVLTSLRATLSQWITWGSQIWDRWGSQILAVVRPVFSSLATMIGTALSNLRDVILIAMALLRGDWGKAWDLLKGIVRRTLEAVKTVAKNGVDAIVAAVRLLVDGVKALGSTFYSAGRELGRKVIDGIKNYISANATSLASDIAGALAGPIGAAVDQAADAIGKSGSGKRAAVAKSTAALNRARAQARIDADAGLAYNQALTQYNAGVTAVENAKKIKDAKKRAVALRDAQAKLATLAENLVQKEAAKQQAAADRVAADQAAAEAEAERVRQEQSDASAAAERAAQDAQAASDQAARDARDAENFRRRALGLRSVEEEAELEAANAIRAQYGLPPVTDMSQIGSSSTGADGSVTSASASMAAGDTGAGFNALSPTSQSTLGSIRDSATRILGGITINGADNPEAVARRIAFILGGSRLRMGGSI